MSGPSPDQLRERSVIIGTQALLAALWKHHPKILQRLAAQGNNVVHPGGKE